MHVDQTIQQAEAIVRFTQEVDRRLAECGLTGTAQLLEIYHLLREALERVNLSEIEWVSQETQRLEQRLGELGTALAHLSALKTAFDVQH